jgi:hypothetical protein
VVMPTSSTSESTFPHRHWDWGLRAAGGKSIRPKRREAVGGCRSPPKGAPNLLYQLTVLRPVVAGVASMRSSRISPKQRARFNEYTLLTATAFFGAFLACKPFFSTWVPTLHPST